MLNFTGNQVNANKDTIVFMSLRLEEIKNLVTSIELRGMRIQTATLESKLVMSSKVG